MEVISMKKTSIVFLCLLIICSFSACNTLNNKNDNNSGTLIRAISGTDETSDIVSMTIISEYGNGEVDITEAEDWEFLKEYTYDSPYPSDKYEELFTFPNTNIIQIKTNFDQETLYIMKDGRIVKQVMCGDSGVEERDYEVYLAKKKYLITEQRLIDLLKKYDKTIEREDSKIDYPEIKYNELNEQEKIIWKYYDTVNLRNEAHPDGDWETRVALTDISEREFRRGFSANSENRISHIGIFNLKSCQIVYIEKIDNAPADLSEKEGLTFETYVVGMLCEVYENEDLFTFDGLNFDEVLVCQRDTEWYILENRGYMSEGWEPFPEEFRKSAVQKRKEKL